MKKTFRSPLIYIVIIVAIILIAQSFGSLQPTHQSDELNYSAFIDKVAAGDISAIQVTATDRTTAELIAYTKENEHEFSEIDLYYDYSVNIPSIEQLESDLISACNVDSIS